ncbi:HAD family hydrolase [Paractinoplanes rishiriensis]|uniref:HAD family hydrolase n=1 Tax=Paractinoplanes rishiriensis TaxID=1050105 RepID=UPI001EF2C23E|nr:HAD-IA family hydrolase [Actinoplanes rishiriensis]
MTEQIAEGCGRHDAGVLRAIVFDLDGTILDTETPEFVSWQEAFAALGVSLDQAVWSRTIGTADSGWDPYVHLEALVGAPVDRGSVRAARRARFDELIAGAEPRAGVLAWLDDARELGLKVGLASSSDEVWVDRFLDALGLRARFEVIATRDRVMLSKPAPDLYRLALDELGVPASEALAVEDSPNGVAAAKAAGLFCVAVPNPLTADLALDGADLTLTSLSDRSLREVAAGI